MKKFSTLVEHCLTSDVNPGNSVDLGVTNHLTPINNILTKDILSFIENNNNRQALILKMYSEGYTFSDIGCMLNMSRQRANLIYRKAINKIRDEFRIEVV